MRPRIGIFFLLASFILPAARAEENQSVCTPANSYLEPYFESRAASGSCVRPAGPPTANGIEPLCEGLAESDFSKDCVREIMKARPVPYTTYRADKKVLTKIFYLNCADGKSKEAPAPCVSDGYVEFVWKAYLDAMRCLSLDPREMVGLIAAESRFQANVGNNASAFGAGQVLLSSGAGIEEKDLLKDYRDLPECASARKLLERKTKPTFPRPCDLTGLPDNPLKNFIYSGIFYKSAHREAAGPASSGGARGRDLMRINHDLALYYYNAGGSHIRPAVENYRRAVPGGMASYGVFSQRFPEYLRQHFGETVSAFQDNPAVLKKKRDEVAGYANAVNSIPQKVSATTGKPCHL